MLKIGKGITREAVAKALRRDSGQTVSYQQVLEADDIRATLGGIQDAGSPTACRPLLTWFASHPNTPEDVLRQLASSPAREVLIGLAVNPRLPEDLKLALLEHSDQDVREHAVKTFSRSGQS